MTCNKAIAYKRLYFHLFYRFSVINKMKWYINMSAVMSTHTEGCQVTQVTIFQRTEQLFFRRRVAGKYLAAENFL